MTDILDTRASFRTITNIFDPENFKTEDVTIEAVAEGLCKTNRFSGQYKGDHMVSVGQHSVRIAKIMMHEATLHYGGYGNLHKEIALWIARLGMIGLVHDGSESFTGDMPTPYKRMMPDFQKVENAIQKTIYMKFLGDLPTEEEYNFLSCVDFRVFNMECIALGRPTIDDPNILGTFKEGESFRDHFGDVRWWGIAETRAMFLKEFNDISKTLAE